MDTTTRRIRAMGRETLADALLSGTWAKIGSHRYQRVTGEVVEKCGNVWTTLTESYGSAWAAISRVDYCNKGRSQC